MDYTYYDSYDYYDYGYDSLSSLDSASLGLGAILGGMMIFWAIFGLVWAVLQIIAMWKIFTKAGEKGWKSIIPIYNLVVLYKISGVSPWLILIFLTAWIPFIGAILCLGVVIYQANSLSKSFRKDIGYTIGLILLSPIFYLILGFGTAEYVGPGGVVSSNDTQHEPEQINEENK